MLPPPGSLPWHMSWAWNPSFGPRHTLGSEGIGAAPLTSTGYLWAIQLYPRAPKISPPALLLPSPHPALPPSLPSANDDVEAQRAGFELQQLPPSMMDFPASHITFPGLVTVFLDSSC